MVGALPEYPLCGSVSSSACPPQHPSLSCYQGTSPLCSPGWWGCSSFGTVGRTRGSSGTSPTACPPQRPSGPQPSFQHLALTMAVVAAAVVVGEPWDTCWGWLLWPWHEGMPLQQLLLPNHAGRPTAGSALGPNPSAAGPSPAVAADHTGPAAVAATAAAGSWPVQHCLLLRLVSAVHNQAGSRQRPGRPAWPPAAGPRRTHPCLHLPTGPAGIDPVVGSHLGRCTVVAVAAVVACSRTCPE